MTRKIKPIEMLLWAGLLGLFGLLLAACAAPESVQIIDTLPASEPMVEVIEEPAQALPTSSENLQPPEPAPTSVVALPTPSETSIPVNEPAALSEAVATIDIQQLCIDFAIQDLTQRLGIAPHLVELLGIENELWSSSALGCPQPGMAYADVMIPGFRLLLQAQGQSFTYHTDLNGQVLLCTEGNPLTLPDIPILKDEKIMDGQPWVPVD